MKAGLVGGTYLMRSPNFNAERSINLFPVLSEVEGSKDVAAMYGTPGTSLYSPLGVIDPIRGLIVSGNGLYICAVAGLDLYVNGGIVGSMATDTGRVSMAENGNQLMIVNENGQSYIYDFTTLTLDPIIDAEYPTSPTYVTFMDGYFIVNNTAEIGKFYYSALYDGMSWAALDSATAESATDGLVAPFKASGQLLLFGDITTEIWYNAGTLTNPFQRISGGVIDKGCAGRFTIVDVDNSVVWVGKDKFGTGIVYRMSGNTPQRISTFAVELALKKAGDLEDLSSLIGFAYQQEGHLFYCLTGGRLETTWVYDFSSGMWHERAYLEEDGTFSQWLCNSAVSYQGRIFGGDRTAGRILEVKPDVYTDDSIVSGLRPIKRTRVFTHLYNEGKRFKINSLQVDFESGVGLAEGTGENPQCWLRMSTDLGHTWSSEYYSDIGRMGEYRRSTEWRRLGVQRAMTFEVSISDPVKVIICGAYFNNNGN